MATLSEVLDFLKPTKAEAEAYLTEERLARWNHLRFRAGMEEITKEQAVAVWLNMTPEARTESMDRIN